ncbi:hypothetical protein BHE74_00036617 [Ensete ventricosum]|nr:hypothetical protein BHE74_00036617 [Ensete ventricosum]
MLCTASQKQAVTTQKGGGSLSRKCGLERSDPHVCGRGGVEALLGKNILSLLQKKPRGVRFSVNTHKSKGEDVTLIGHQTEMDVRKVGPLKEERQVFS